MKRLSIDEYMRNPEFIRGYIEIFNDADFTPPVARLFDDPIGEALYETGRQFGIVVKNQGNGFMPLMRRGTINQEAVELLALALKTKEVCR